MSDKKESRDFETASSSKPPSTSATTGSTWSRFKDPRVVRVSRALGGKDRHSKVCTVRGLRDRRVRLSVPTAIQLYDLQERLGLNQPSKVVDWLLNAAKNEIDELPPLQIPQGMFNFTNYQTNNNNNNNNNSYNLDQPMLNFQDFGSSGSHHHHLEDNTNNDDSIFKMDPSSLTLAHTAHPRGGQQEDWHGFGLMPFQQGLVYHHHHQPGIAYLPAGGTSHEVSVVQRSQLSSSPFGSTGQPSDHRQMHDFNLLQPSIQDHNEETET